MRSNGGFARILPLEPRARAAQDSDNIVVSLMR